MKLLEKILVPVQINEISVDHLEVPIQLAKKFQSQLILLHVLPDEARKDSINSLIMKYVKSDFERIQKELDKTGIKTKKRIAYGSIADQTLSVSEEEEVNLILLGNEQGQSGDNSRLNTLAEKLIRKTQKPVWIDKVGSKNRPERILCPVDFSEASERALNNAIKISKTFQSELHIITVFEPLEENSSLRYNIDYEKENKELEQESEQKFKDFLKKFNFIDIEYQTRLVRGKVHEQVIAFAREREIDLIFMGATGKSMLQRVLLGSVTERVIRELPSSMVITKAESILNLKLDHEISEIEKHYTNALQLEKKGYYDEAIDQLKICLQINDLHIPALSSLSKLYEKVGKKELSDSYRRKLEEILRRLWDRKIEAEIRKNYKL